MEPTTFAVASEDYNMYTFDMRNLSSATQIYKGHVGAVMSVDWAPTGQSLVTGSYDRTVRLWDVGKGARSRDVYHTKRMQKVFAVSYTLDARFVLSGSDDVNVRLWKHRASDKLGIVNARERASREYAQALRQRWNSVGDVAKIERQRHVPKPIRTAQKLQHTMTEARRVKEDRRRRHTKVRALCSPSEWDQEAQSRAQARGGRGERVVHVIESAASRRWPHGPCRCRWRRAWLGARCWASFRLAHGMPTFKCVCMCMSSFMYRYSLVNSRWIGT